MVTETQVEVAPVNRLERSMAAEASSAHARINIPLNLENWKGLPPEIQDQLVWFHQHALDRKLTMAECAEALNYDNSTVFRVLKGTYEGSWRNVADAIRSYRRIDAERGTIQRAEFTENAVTRLVFAAMDYSVANNSIALIMGESGQGKTCSVFRWKDLHNHGRTVYTVAPAVGGTKGLMRKVAAAVGVNKNLSSTQMPEAIARAFNKNRTLIVDEAHELLPGDPRSKPVSLEWLRQLHDETQCALVLVSTARFESTLAETEYMFEQLLGRISPLTRLPRRFGAEDVEPLVRQYVRRPSQKMMAQAVELANDLRGRIRVLAEVLKLASRIAAKAQAQVTEETFFKAIAVRNQLRGEVVYAKS